MAKFTLIIISFLTYELQVQSQIIRSPLSLLSRSIPDTIIETPRPFAELSRNYIETPRNFIETPRNFIETPRNYIETPRNFIETPRNFIESRRYAAPVVVADQPCSNISPIKVAPTPTVITDCTPSVCKNLADTIQLMIVCNLLQNYKDKADLQMGAPILNKAIAAAGLVGPSFVTSDLVSPSLVGPSLVTSKLIAPNLVGPNLVGPNLVASNCVPSNLVSSNSIASRVMSSNPGIVPNIPMNNGVLNILKILGSSV